MEKVIILDTTLRDGEQSPGASMNLNEKIEIARSLRDMKVDVIEAGFPAASPGDFEAVRAIAQTVDGVRISGLARTKREDIDRAAEAVRDANLNRIHTFIGTSPSHRKYKLRKTEPEIIQIAQDMVSHAKSYVDDVEFSPEDAARTEPDYLAEVVEKAIDAGATTINIPDTVGYTLPNEFHTLITHLFNNVSNISKAVISVHCHNDLGMAVANSLAAVQAGARQVECTINGIGERAGNCALEEIVMSIQTRKDILNVKTAINTRKIYYLSRLVSGITGFEVQRNKAIVGSNAFAHEAGIHQDGIIKDRSTYEIMKAEDVGVPSATFVLGKHSGRNAFRKHLEELGFHLDADGVQRAYDEFIALADKKKEVYDEDLIALVEGELSEVDGNYELVSVHTSSGNTITPTATVRLEKDEEELEDAACGDGPVDAICKTINRITGLNCVLQNYKLRAVTKGTDAMGEVTVDITEGDNACTGKGVHTDIVIASANAYLNAVNRLTLMRKRKT